MTQPPPHVPYYEGPPAETFQPQPPAPVTPRSRAPFVAGGVAVVAAVAVGAALIVAAPWQHDRTPTVVSPVAQAPSVATHAAPTVATVPSGPTLDHTAAEQLLVDFEDATAPVCNGGKDVAAKVGKTFTCVEGSQKWTVRITEVQPDGGVRYELVD